MVSRLLFSGVLVAVFRGLLISSRLIPHPISLCDPPFTNPSDMPIGAKRGARFANKKA